MKIYFVGRLTDTFVYNDYKILNKYFDVDIIQPLERRNEWL